MLAAASAAGVRRAYGVAPPPSSGDPYWSNVVALISMEGINGSTVFTDLKGLVAWTASGNAQISTANGAFPGGSGLFDGTGDYIRTPASSILGFGGGDYTVEGYQYQATNSLDRCVFDNRGASNTGIGIYVSQAAANQNFRLTLTSNSATIGGALGPLFTNNTRQHWSISRQGSTTYGHIDGGLAFSAADVRTQAASPSITIGANYVNTQGFLGNLGWVRITKGVGRYGLGSFTPPATPMPDY